MLSVRISSQVSTHCNFIEKSTSSQHKNWVLKHLIRESLNEELAACQHLLNNMHAEHGKQEVFIFSLSDLDNKEINEKLDEVFANLKCAAKVNLALEFILQNVETNNYRYYYPHENNLLLDRAFLLSNRNNLLNLQSTIEKIDLIETCTEDCQNSKWRFRVITNVTVFAALLTNIPMGCSDFPLPEPLLRNPEVNCLVSNEHDEPYNDYLRLFRAIAINLFGSRERVKNVYPRGVYSSRETLLEKLDNFSIAYPEDDTLFKSLAVFDFEAICVHSVDVSNTATTSWIGFHVPVSVLFSSNMLKETIFICDEDPNRFIISFVAKLETLAAKNKVDVRSKFLEVEAEIKTSFSDISSKLEIISASQSKNSNKAEDSNASKKFLRYNKRSSLISSVISIIMLTLYQFLDSTVERMI